MELPFVPRLSGALLGSSILFVSLTAAAGIGRTPGFATVSDEGEARYTIPITLPPGTNGMTPVVSLEYSHRHKGGLLGIGWSIGGLSQITRCRSTIAQDGGLHAPGAINRYCLDGQRLVPTTSPLSSTPPTEYRTEIESYARIRAVGATSTSMPSHFILEAADGRIYEYGATGESRIDGVAGPSTKPARAWALNRIRDRSGNVIDYRYTEDSTSAAYRLASIKYNANPTQGVAISHDVAFYYERRPHNEADVGFVANMPVREVMRLTRVDVRYQHNVLRRYALAYEPALSSGGRGRLASVTECGIGGTDCLSPTRLQWQGGADGVSAMSVFAAQTTPLAQLPPGSAWTLTDLNGDGRDDYVWSAGASAATSTLRYRLSLADGALGPLVDPGIATPRGIGRPFDANGDGRMDLLMSTSSNRWAIAYGHATGLGAPVDTGISLPSGQLDYRGADLNGDGLGDIAWSQSTDIHGNDLRVLARFAQSGGGFGAPVTLYSQPTSAQYPFAEGGDFIGDPGRRIDLNGDGAEDLLMNENYSVARIMGHASSTDRFDIRIYNRVPLDFNDDGCTDFAYHNYTAGRLRVRVSACGGSGGGGELEGLAMSSGAELAAHDWNGDGRDDLLVRGASEWMVAVSLGDTLAPLVGTGVAHESAAVIAGRDLDGDGLEDFAWRTDAQLRTRLRSGTVPDLLLSVTDGFNVGAVFTYRPLTDADVHQRGSAARWPDQDLQTADHVVSRLAVTHGTGSGGKSSIGLRYEGLRRNHHGRGSLGFRKVVRVEAGVSGPLTRETVRRQDFPFAGLPESDVLRQSSGRTVTATDYQWSKLDLGGSSHARRFPYLSNLTTRRYEVGGPFDGNEIARTVRNIAAIDPASGLVTDETTTTTEMGGGANSGSSSSLRIIHGSVLNDTAHWCLGRSQSVELTASHTLPGGAAIERSADQAWDGAACRPTRIRLFPGDSQWQVTYDFTYDAFGNLASEKVTGAGMPARTMSMNWGTRGQLPIRIANPLSQLVRYAWNEGMGLPLSVTDPNGIAIQWSYDAFGRPTQERQPDGTSSRWTREACKAGCNTRTKYRIRQDDVDTLGVVKRVSWLEVDQHDRGFRLETQQPGGGYSVSTFDSGARGEVTRQYLPHWDNTTPPGHLAFTYDAIGRPTAVELIAFGGAVARSTAIRYEGHSITQTDGAGRTANSTRTAWGNLTEAVDALGGRSRYEYDAFGALLRARDAVGDVVASIGYNPRGMKVSVADVDRGSWSWTRNALGETTALRDGKGQVTQFTYDALGRLTRRTSNDGTSTWTWGAAASSKNIGRLAALAGPGYSESFGYDSIGRPASRTISADASYRFDYSYDGDGLLSSVAYPAAGAGNRFTLRYTYDAGRLARISDVHAPYAPFWRLNAQDAAGKALDETLGATVRVISGFSPITGELEYRQSGAGGGAAIQDVAYAWDAAGNLASRRDSNRNLFEEFRYDVLGRLRESRLNGAVALTLDYDAIGNIRRKSDVCPGTAPCYTYHATRKHAVTSAGGQSYAYDANGNMTSRAGATIAWNSENLPVSLAHANGNNSSFSYGAEGNRWKQVARHGAATETTVYAGGLFEKVTRAGATTWRHYAPAPGGVVLHLRHSEGTPAATRYLTLDHLGSTGTIIDAAGNELVAESFQPFGQRRQPDGSGIPTAADLAKIAAATRDGFTGHEHLDNLDLIHMNGRVYDPRLGRFLSADPFVSRPYDGQGLNRFAYALNNPLLYTDPSGFDPVPCLANESGNCVQIVVIAASLVSHLRASGGAHAAEIASALERDPCGQNGSAGACAMQGVQLISPQNVVLTVGSQPDWTLSRSGRFDAAQGFAARLGNLAFHASPIVMLLGSDPDYEYFKVPDSEAGRQGAQLGNVGMLAGGAAGIIRDGGFDLIRNAPSAIARSLQGSWKYPNIDRFRDIILKKGTILFAGFPGQGRFYTTANAMRRSQGSATKLWDGLQIAMHEVHPPRSRIAVYEVLEDTKAAFGLALANTKNGAGGYPQVVVPSFSTSLRYLNDFELAP